MRNKCRYAAPIVLLTALVSCGAEPIPGPVEMESSESPLYYGNLWKKRERISVCWMPKCSATDCPGLAGAGISDATIEQRKRAVRDIVVDTWGRHSSLAFYDWDDCPATPYLRSITVTPHENGWSSWLGPDPRLYGPDPDPEGDSYYAKIQINFRLDGDNLRKEVLEEFGHTLGFAHEQNRPDEPADADCGLCPDPNALNGGCAKVRHDVNGVCRCHSGEDNGNNTFGAFDEQAIVSYCGTKGTNPSGTDYAGLVHLYGPELGVPLRQTTSGMCIHPVNGSSYPADGTPAVLYPDCTSEPRLQFVVWSEGGPIMQASSGSCLRPERGGSNPTDNTRLVFGDDRACSDFNAQFAVTTGGSLRHIASGKCVHPYGGSATPSSQTELVLYSGCDEPRLYFDGVLAEGRLAHLDGACVHPRGGADIPSDDTPAILYHECYQWDRLQFRMLANGSIQHVLSAKCLGPTSTDVTDGTTLGFRSDCNAAAQRFELMSFGNLRHVASGKCIHPSGGSAHPTDDTELVLWGECYTGRIRFAPVMF